MGLDTVELLVAVEKHFGINIPDREAEEIETVQDFANSVYEKIPLAPAQHCLTQIVFYRLRQAFIQLGNHKENVQPDTLLSTLLPEDDREVAWQQLSSVTKLELPELIRGSDQKRSWSDWLLGLGVMENKTPICIVSLRKLVDWVISLNFAELTDVQSITSYYEIERIICGIISDRMGIPIDEIELKHSIVRDLGIE